MRTFIAFAALCTVASGASVKWTGVLNNQQWDTPTNWYPARVPGAGDDVTIADAEGKDTKVIIVTPITVNSLTVGSAANNVRLDVLNKLTVTGDLTIGNMGTMEVNSGAAIVTCDNTKVSGALEFHSGILTGSYSITGKASIVTQAAKFLKKAVVNVNSQTEMIVDGSLQFLGGSVVTTNTGIVSSGKDFQFIVMDKSVGNKFTANGFSWAQ